MTESAERTTIETEPPSEAILAALMDLIPGAVADGVIDAARIGEAAGLPVAGLKDSAERFGLMWAGKSKAVEALQAPSMATLAPNLEESINWDSAENIFIEGDNLEVLKLLQKAYNDQVKLIYIDPPYNTGNDFVYNDDFSQPLKHYLEVTGQVDAEGNRLVANTEVSGRKHSNWLNMMYPRLVLARNLLAENGAIVISIDDNEAHNLRVLLDEVFGQENFVAQLVWQSRPSVQNDTDISSSHEYLLVYARNRRSQNRRLKSTNVGTWYEDPSFAVFPKATDVSRYTRDDDDGRGIYKEDPFDAPNIRPNLTYEITNPNSGEKFMPPPGRHWRTSEAEFARLNEENRISWGVTGIGRPKQKSYYADNSSFGEVPTTWITSEIGGSAAGGTRELQGLFGGRAIFDTAKPTKLLQHVLGLTVKSDDIVLDFFSGSGTTGHAIFLSNAEQLSAKKFILVNLPEATSENSAARELGIENVSKITQMRIKKVMEQMPSAMAQGLRIFKMAGSAFADMKPVDGQLFTQTLNSTATDDQISAEIFLKNGVRLDMPWQRLIIATSPVIISDGVAVVLSKALNDDIVSGLLEHEDCHTVVFLEDAFAGLDNIKANAYFAFKQANKTMKTI